MKHEQLHKIFELSSRIDNVRGLVQMEKIPIELAIKAGNESFQRGGSRLHSLYDLYAIPDNVQFEVRKILDRAAVEIKEYLHQELSRLEEKFSKIKIKDGLD